MSDKSLSKYSRTELLNLLYNQQKKIEELEVENENLKRKLEDKKIRIDGVGSIAEASLALTDIFKQAQEAADLYLENVKSVASSGERINVTPIKQNPQPVKQNASSAPANNVRPQVQPKPQPQPQPRPQTQQRPQSRPQVQQQVQRPQVQRQPQPQFQQVQQPQVQYRQVSSQRKPKPSPKPLINPRPLVQVLPDENVIDYSDYEAMMNDSPIMLDDDVRRTPRKETYRREVSEAELPKRAKRTEGSSRQSSRNTKQNDLVKEMEMDILGQFDKVTKSDSSEQYRRSRHAKRRRSQ